MVRKILIARPTIDTRLSRISGFDHANLQQQITRNCPNTVAYILVLKTAMIFRLAYGVSYGQSWFVKVKKCYVTNFHTGSVIDANGLSHL